MFKLSKYFDVKFLCIAAAALIIFILYSFYLHIRFLNEINLTLPVVKVEEADVKKPKPEPIKPVDLDVLSKIDLPAPPKLPVVKNKQSSKAKTNKNTADKPKQAIVKKNTQSAAKKEPVKKNQDVKKPSLAKNKPADTSKIEKKTPKPSINESSKHKEELAKKQDIAKENNEPEFAKTGQELMQDWQEGKGPLVEINWPQGSHQQNRLSDYIYRCLGARLGAVSKDQVELLSVNKFNSQPGQMLHMVSGNLSDKELSDWQKRANYNSTPVRIFPAHVEHALFNGIAQLSQKKMPKHVTGEYQLENNQLILKKLAFDTKQVNSEILLAKSPYCGQQCEFS